MKFNIVEPHEDRVLDCLDDALFFGEIVKDELSSYGDIESLTAVDIVAGAAITRALRLSIPDGISATIYRKGIKKYETF